MRIKHYYKRQVVKRYVNPGDYSLLIKEYSPHLALWKIPSDKRPVCNLMLKEVEPATQVIEMRIYIDRDLLKEHVEKALQRHNTFFEKYENNGVKRDEFRKRMREGLAKSGSKPGRKPKASKRKYEGSALSAFSDPSLWQETSLTWYEQKKEE